jgi:hypothetical protein
LGSAKLFATTDAGEHLRVEVPSRVQRRPARPHDVPRSEDGGWETGPPCLVQKPGLDGGLLHAILAEGVEWIVLGRGHRGVVAIHPDGAAVQKVLHSTMQCLDQRLRAGQVEGDHVHHDVRLERGDARAEGAGGVLSRPVSHNLLYLGPGRVRPVGRGLPSADVHHLVPAFHKSRHKVGAHMAAAANHHHTRHVTSPSVLGSGLKSSLSYRIVGTSSHRCQRPRVRHSAQRGSATSQR